MNAGEKGQIKISFPFDVYLKQLFFTDTYVRYLNPFSFWRKYKINYLETCYQLNTVQYLESCRKLDYQVVKHTGIKLDLDYADASAISLIEQAKLNTIYITQPRIKLKYCGVSYYTKDILNININVVKIDPRLVRANNLKFSDNSDNAGTSEKSSSN